MLDHTTPRTQAEKAVEPGRYAQDVPFSNAMPLIGRGRVQASRY